MCQNPPAEPPAKDFLVNSHHQTKMLAGNLLAAKNLQLAVSWQILSPASLLKKKNADFYNPYILRN